MSFAEQQTVELVGSSGNGDIAYAVSNASQSGAFGYAGNTIVLGDGSQSYQYSTNTAGQIASDLLRLNAANGGYGSTYTIANSYVPTVATTYVPAATTYVPAAGPVLESSAYSEIEQAILKASNPIPIVENDLITVNGQSGIWANKAEVVNWRGPIPITQYLINEDASPEIIRKRTEQQLIYDQEIAIRYLRPPTPPPPGEIIIRQEKNIPTPPAPPLVIRQQPPRPETPAPLVVREAPPRPPAQVGAKVVTISGKRLPPPPRKVIIERLAPLPSKPQSIFIERWLPYSQQKRRVIFQKSNEPDPIIPKPRNVIVQWETPAVTVKKEFKDLGVIRANPSEYVARYGASLKNHIELPGFVREIRPPAGVVLAAEYQAPQIHELEGDLHALNLIDLDREGLGEYRSYLSRAYTYNPEALAASSFSVTATQVVNAILTELFSSIDINADGRITINEAEKILLKLNSRLGRRYGEDDVRAFFAAYDLNQDGKIDLDEFKRGILRDLNL